MSSFSPELQAYLAQRGVLMFGAVEIQLPDATIRLLDGSGQATLFGEDYTGRDPTYGPLGGVSAYTDGVDDEAPSLTLTINPPTNAAMAALAAPAAQGSQVTIWQGAIDPTSGEVVPDPDLCFIGELDVPTQRVGQNTRQLDLTVISIFDRFLENDEGFRLNNGFQQTVWPGELGLEYVTATQQQMPWGSDAPRPSLVTDVAQIALNQAFGRPNYY